VGRVLKKRRRARAKPAEPGVSTRTQILLGASQAFGAKGYAETSVEDILKASGVARRTFYRSFRSKADVFEQLFEAATMMFLQAMRTAADLGKTGEEKIANCIDVYLSGPRTAGPIFYVFQSEIMRPGSALAARRTAVIDELVEMMGDGFADFHGHDADPLVVRGVVAALENVSTYIHTRTDGTATDIERARAAMMHIVGTALGGPA
jgi:AcrR family transcriptional regulator